MAKKQIPFIVWVMIVAGILGGLFALTQRKDEQESVEQKTITPTPVLQVQKPQAWKPTPTSITVDENSPSPESPGQNVSNSLPPIAAQQAELEKQVRGWRYQGFMALGRQKIGQFSRSEKDGGNFRASEGDIVEGVTIANITQNGAILQSGEARVIMSLERPIERIEREEPQPPPQSGPPPRKRSENRSDMGNENRPGMRRSVDQPGNTGVISTDHSFTPEDSDSDRNESPFRR